MLSRLSIDNYALIEKSDIEFSPGFTVITGETGAGKSIMLDALSLLMGARADSKTLGSNNRKMIVEGVFSNPDDSIKTICIEHDIDWDAKEIILRREISVSGKSRGFVNDTPVNLALLSAISEKLIDIHSQHSNSLLNSHSQQMLILDSFAGNNKLLSQYRETFKEYVELRNRIKKVKENIIKGKENKEYLLFRLEQLEKIKPKKGELEVLERESELLGDADKIKSELSDASELLAGGMSALKQLQSAASIVENIDFDLLDPNHNQNIHERLDSLKIEIRDIADSLNEYAEKIESDPSHFEKIQNRIKIIYDTIKRFKVKDENELVDLHSRLKKELDLISTEAIDIPALEKQLKSLALVLKERADRLSEAREKAAISFSDTITERIRPLGLPNMNFHIEIQKGKMSADGQDNVVFYCSFNKNHPLQPISDIASGGEISRVMLGIKSVMAEIMNLPTIILDEIDAGVSGEIAHKMGRMMRTISENIQVMSVTHLPQVAANGNEHLKVYKEDVGEKTVSHIKLLTPEERIIEIASMLSGSYINDVALENAKVLLNSK